MALIESESLVLKTYNLAEADRIVVFLTHDHGMIRGVAKGAKRLNSRFGGGLEPFSVVRLTYFQKEALELVSIRNVELVRSFFASAADPDFLQKFSYLSELLVAVTPPQDPNKDLYRMVIACLEACSQSNENLQGVGLYFEIWLMRLAGYLPDWSLCDQCKLPFPGITEASVQANFHLLCDRCKRGGGASIVTARQRELFNEALRLSPTRFAEVAASSETEVLAVSQVLRRIISNVIGREVTGEKSLALSI